MRKLLIATLLSTIVLACKSQITGTYQIKGADTMKVWKPSGSTEFILMNNTDTVPGFLFNTGLGITKFKRALTKINNNTYLIGPDTLIILPTAAPAGSNTQIQFNDGGALGAVNTLTYDKVKQTFVTGGSNNTLNSGANFSAVIGQSNTVNGNYSLVAGNTNVAGANGYVFGANSNAQGYSISVGNNNNGTNAYSGTIGQGLQNIYQNGFVVGQFNDSTQWAGAATVSDISAYPVFSIGNGTSNSLRSNALTVLHNGTIITVLRNNGTLDSVLIVDQNGIIKQKKFTGGGGGISTVGLVVPTGFSVSGSPITGSGGTITISTTLSGVVHGTGSGLTASQIVDADVANVAWSKITSTPTTVTGYGIINAARTDIAYNDPTWINTLNWSKIISTPTSLSGYGITDPVVLTTGSYGNPTWITSLAWSKITGTPTTTGGYGITNVVNSINGLAGVVVMKNADSIMHLPVDTSVRRNGYVITFDSTNHKWYLSPGGGGATSFASLSDVSVTSPANNQIPVYVTGTGKWTNTSVSTSIISEGSNLYWTNARFDTQFATKTTDNLSEGASNLYFTNSRARSAISASAPISYSSSSGVISLSSSGVVAGPYTFPTFQVSLQGLIVAANSANINKPGIGMQTMYTTTRVVGSLNVTDLNFKRVHDSTYNHWVTLNDSTLVLVLDTASLYSANPTVLGNWNNLGDTLLTNPSANVIKAKAIVKGFGITGSPTDTTVNIKFDSTAGGGFHTQPYYDLRYAKFITLTTTGTSGAATWNASTGALNIPNYASGSGVPLDATQTYTSGSTVTVSNGNNVLYVDPASTQSSLTITLPATPHTGNRMIIHFGGTITSGIVITTLTIVGNSGQTIVQAVTPTTASYGEDIMYDWRSGTSTWYRMN